jgi:hypothetical protein
VVHRQTADRLIELSDFVYRNLSFVRHVAFMGLEPMGFARVNRDLLWIDPADYCGALQAAAWYLQDRGIPTSIYNVPLCVLDRESWPLARQSISDWKNTFVPECAGCAVRAQCCGFFRSAGSDWRSRAIEPISTKAVA